MRLACTCVVRMAEKALKSSSSRRYLLSISIKYNTRHIHINIVCVKWGEETSEYFKCTNGVRQGGILSPLLFNVYLTMSVLN